MSKECGAEGLRPRTPEDQKARRPGGRSDIDAGDGDGDPPPLEGNR